ncbi:hypothetical protein [Bosea sp. NPDC055594]
MYQPQPAERTKRVAASAFARPCAHDAHSTQKDELHASNTIAVPSPAKMILDASMRHRMLVETGHPPASPPKSNTMSSKTQDGRSTAVLSEQLAEEVRSTAGPGMIHCGPAAVGQNRHAGEVGDRIGELLRQRISLVIGQALSAVRDGCHCNNCAYGRYPRRLYYQYSSGFGSLEKRHSIDLLQFPVSLFDVSAFVQFPLGAPSR